MPLLWFLRDELGLGGTKFGCGTGMCGACTVHLDGKPIRSCQISVGQLKDRRITTIEGIPEDHPVKKAWEEHSVPQCGYCQCGQMMSAIALLEKNSHPSDAQINQGMRGNLCRCGTYSRIRAAIHTAARSK